MIMIHMTDDIIINIIIYITYTRTRTDFYDDNDIMMIIIYKLFYLLCMVVEYNIYMIYDDDVYHGVYYHIYICIIRMYVPYGTCTVICNHDS